MSRYGIPPDCQVVAVTDEQGGDNGKGKVVDGASEDFDVIGRGTGGANAGHTICVNGRRFVLHLLPSAILRDTEGKTNIIGRGVAFNPRLAVGEITALRAAGVPCANLKISYRAKLVLPQHLLLDWVREKLAGAAKIDTTMQGIGPCYVDHYARVGLTVSDLLNPNVLMYKLQRNLAEKLLLLKSFDPAEVEAVMRREPLARRVASTAPTTSLTSMPSQRRTWRTAGTSSR
jgi:adenylosuccinate synthase